MRRPLLPLALLAAALAGACEAAPERGAHRPAVGVVDSALSIDTLLHRFRATVPDTPTTLIGGADSREALVRELFAALGQGDSLSVRRLAVTAGEFAWLYYPHSRFTRAPYELGPDLLWLQLRANHEKGVVRLLRRYGGRPLRLETVSCPDSARTEGPNVLTEGCRVTFAVADSTPRELRLFGSLFSRDGRHKFLSYSNDL